MIRARHLSLIVLVVAAYFALWHQPLPSATGSGPRAAELERVFAHLEFLARGERTRGTEHHAASIEYLVRAVEEQGHAVEVQQARFLSAPVLNVVGFAPGSDSTGAVVVMGHFDTVYNCPGASDDGAGTAAALASFLAIAREGHRNDIVLLLTDGEELDMHGATVFVQQHPRFESVRAVVNLEALGNAGPAWLFETGPEDGRWIAEFARTAPLPIGNSLAEPIYRTLMSRRNTDFTRFRDRGVGGLNFAMVWGTSANHTWFDSYPNIQRESVAHLYDCGRAALRVLADADLAAEPLPEPVFFELPFVGMVVIAPLWSRVLSVLAVALALVVTWLSVRRGGLGRSAAGLVIGVVALGFAIGAALGATNLLRGAVELAGFTGAPTGNALSMRFFAVGVACVAAGVFVALIAKMKLATGWFALPWAAAVVALEAQFPGGAHQGAVPLLCLCVVALVPERHRGAATVLAAAFTAVFLGPLLRTLPQIVSQMLTGATLAGAFPAAAVVALALVPCGARFAPRRGLLAAGLGLVSLTVWAVLDALGR